MSTTITAQSHSYVPKGRFDFIGRSKSFYIGALVLIVASIAAILIRGFDFSMDFEGGTKVSMPAGDLVAQDVADTFTEATGVIPETAQIVGSGDSRTVEIHSETLSEQQASSAREAIAREHADGARDLDTVGVSAVSESWGATITERMLISMAAFIILAGLYVAIRLKREMAIAALAALTVDGIVIAGIYALFGLEVSPAVVIGLLTVLTFSIYDTVIVFDKVNENTAGVLDSRRATFAEQANLAVNQTVMRSISTTVISILPIIALFVVAVWLMGVGTLRDLALIQLIGVIEGIFSSLLLATPILVSLINRQDKYAKHNKAVASFRAGGANELVASDEDETAGQAQDETAMVGKRTVTSPVTRSTGASWRPEKR